MKRTTLILAALLIAGLALAQGLHDSSAVVTVTAPARVHAGVGETVEIPVTLDIAEGWHLYAHGDTTYYGISVTGLDTVPLAVVEVDYPEGHMGEFLGHRVRLLEGRESLILRGVLMTELDAPLRFELECQACDDASCLAPAWIPFVTEILPEE